MKLLLVWLAVAAATEAENAESISRGVSPQVHHTPGMPFFKYDGGHYAVDLDSTIRFQQPVEAAFRRRLWVPACSSCGCSAWTDGSSGEDHWVGGKGVVGLFLFHIRRPRLIFAAPAVEGRTCRPYLRSRHHHRSIPNPVLRPHIQVARRCFQLLNRHPSCPLALLLDLPRWFLPEPAGSDQLQVLSHGEVHPVGRVYLLP
jgi:hypothetical protein